MISSDELRRLKMGLSDKKPIDIADVSIDPEKPVEHRAASYIEQIGNPYCFLCEGTLVRVEYNENGKTIDQSLVDYFKANKG